jgi:hypothetical protein
MTPTEIIELAVAMREAQTKAGTDRTKMNLERAKALELRFDQAARRFLDSPRDQTAEQGALF